MVNSELERRGERRKYIKIEDKEGNRSRHDPLADGLSASLALVIWKEASP